MMLKYILIIFISIFSLNNCGFINSEYIKDLSSISDFDSELKKTNISTGMMLIYLTYCGHCHNFLKTYESLALKYNKKLLFFAMNVYSDYHKRMPRTGGVPYILFFSEGYFYQFNGRRSYEELSSIIENDYLSRCKKISYKNIENVYYNIFLKNEKYNNLIIGFFEGFERESIINFREENKLLNEDKIGLCYVCNDFNENQNKNGTLFKYIESNVIVGYLRNNISKIFLWNNKDKDKNNRYYNYEKFINEDLESDYIDINEEKKKYLINFLRNKNNLIFSYKTNDERMMFENYINELKNITEYKINFVLYNFPNFKENFFEFINESGLYSVNENLNFIDKFNNFEQLKHKIFKEFNKTIYLNHTIKNELLMPDLTNETNKEDNEEEDDKFDYDFFFEILEKICVILFTTVLTMAIFFFNYNRYYKKVDQNIVNYYTNQK